MVKCPARSSPVHPTNIQEYFKMPFSNKNNCFSSIELHKTGHESESHLLKKDKANGFIAFVNLLWSVTARLLIPKWRHLKAWSWHDTERSRKWRQNVTKQFFSCLQMPRPPRGGRYYTPNTLPPGLIINTVKDVLRSKLSLYLGVPLLLHFLHHFCNFFRFVFTSFLFFQCLHVSLFYNMIRYDPIRWLFLVIETRFS